MVFIDVFWEILRRHRMGAIVADMLIFLGPVGIAFFIGIMVGWAWKPRWASLRNCKFDVKNQGFGSNLNFRPDNKNRNVVDEASTLLLGNDLNPSSSTVKKEENHLLTDEDLKHLWHLVERKDDGPPWKHMMDRSTSNMHYQAWQRDPETGPPQYCSKTVYENATPELMRDFFWDDEFRLKWDDMLLHASIIEEFPTTGTSVVHWIRKFPFFCSDREYTIARRIWQLGRSYYCVTKGIPCLSVPRKQKPRRVDLYYSSWFIRSVKSNISDQRACEVTFFHHEDMGIPWEIAKFGVRQGMWGAARKVEHGLRLYQQERAFSKTISLHVAMAQTSTKIDETHLDSLESEDDQVAEMGKTQVVAAAAAQEKPAVGMKVPKLLVIGAAVIVACSIDRGLFTKAAIFGVTKRFASTGRQAGRRR